MGTNYYMKKGQYVPEADYDHPLSGLIREGTGRPAAIHIGKSSYGWCFSLHVMPQYGIHDLTDWRAFAVRLLGEGWRIEDEYGEAFTAEELWRVVERADWERQEVTNCDQLKLPAAVRPLQRHDVDGDHCIGNGEGFYDYIVGEFS
jgi:hypothetical protein